MRKSTERIEEVGPPHLVILTGDLAFSANSANNYQRMPHIVTMGTVRQSIPRMWFPEAITQGKSFG